MSDGLERGHSAADDWDDWEVDALLRPPPRQRCNNAGWPANGWSDAAPWDDGFAAGHSAGGLFDRSEGRSNAEDGSGGILAWAVLAVGTTAACCGGVLLGLGWFDGRGDLRTMGVPVVMGGLLALLLGVALHLERQRRARRRAEERMRQLRRQLDDLRRAAHRLSVGSGPALESFYMHAADGAGPHVLLAELRGKLDLLAREIARGSH